jgi:hypothetical protein
MFAKIQFTAKAQARKGSLLLTMLKKKTFLNATPRGNFLTGVDEID